ncbi:MAG: PolC-type DNA polymerase III [bacterium]|nr:PolC-type DNA polymerase III [bacterium]
MDQRMNTLLQLLQIDDQFILQSGSVQELLVDNAMGEWFFKIEFERPLPLIKYRHFTEKLKQLPTKVDYIKQIDYQVVINQSSEDDLLDYYDFSLDELIEQDKRALPLKDYPINVVNRVLQVTAPVDAKSVIWFQEKIESQLKKNGFVASLVIVVDEEKNTIQDAIEKTNITFVANNESITPFKTRFDYFYPDKPIEGPFISIRQIPQTEFDLEDYKAKNKNKAVFQIKGTVVSIEIRSARNGSSASIIVTDKTDSILVKKRLMNDEEKRFANDVKEGLTVMLEGMALYDSFYGEVVINAYNIAKSSDILPRTDRVDDVKEKRIELHVHTKMSPLDGVNSIEEYVVRAKHWGHLGIAVTDHGSVQSFPELSHLSAKMGVKGLYGLELTYVNDETISITKGTQAGLLSECTYCVFDIESTGLSVIYDHIIEIAGYKVKGGQTIGNFHTYIDAGIDLSEFTKEFTGITMAKLKGAPTLKQALIDFLAFSSGCVLVAHNAMFDVDFIIEKAKSVGLVPPTNPVIDTIVLSKVLYPERQSHSLWSMSKLLKVQLNNHHSAIEDAKTLMEIFLTLVSEVKKQGIHKFNDLNFLINRSDIHKIPYPKHINLLVKKQEGLKNLYKILSIASTDTFDKEPKVVKSTLDKLRKGLLVGSGCRNSDFFEIATTKNHEALVEAAKYYDYLELQPLSSFEYYRFKNPLWKEHIMDVMKRIVQIGKELNIPVVATGDVHHIDPEDLIYRKIMISSPLVGGGFHKLHGEEEIPCQHYLTTKEMLEEFSFLGEETAFEIVVTNSHLIYDQIDSIEIFPKELFAPTDEFLADKGIPSIKVKVENMVKQKAAKLYGKELPGIVSRRMEKELRSIIDHHFATIYYISHLLVKKSLDDGYLVGSRGSVGSSFAATLLDITEVNPLSPHYRCPNCQFSAFKKTDEDKLLDGVSDFEAEHYKWFDHVDCGYDLPDTTCPVCNTPLKKDGHDIPFETFLGFKGDKVPDIDLNFSGDYQGEVHNYIRTLFGENYAFRAGTIGTCAAKTAFGMVREFFDKKNAKSPEQPIKIRRAEMDRLSQGIVGSKRTSGQHPGGIVVVPNNKEIYDVTPIQYPGDSMDKDWKTTHFDYHSFENNLFKLDVLGHDDPTMIRYLMDIVFEHPLEFPFSDPADIPVDDKEVYKLLSGTDIIGLKAEDIKSDVASYGIPELGTNFVRGMLRDTRPQNFSELVKISGLSHGTDVWSSNAQDLVLGKRGEFGRIEFKDIIGCRDDIMVDLIGYGMPPTMAFEIMEFVRKGKAPAMPDKWATYADKMRSAGVPDWYTWSCSKIKYMFPKAHATAYVLMAMRIAWFKLYRPIYFYSAYFSKRANVFDVSAMMAGASGIEKKLAEIDFKGNEATTREKDLQTVLELALEMVKRGYSFEAIDINRSHSTNFLVGSDKQSLIIPFIALESLGLAAANSVIEARNDKPFLSKQDVKLRTKLSSTLFERLTDLGAFGDLMEESQMSLFDF